MKTKQETESRISFKRLLRIVVGGNAASARTETDRMDFLRRFLRSVLRGMNREHKWLKSFAKDMPESIPLETIPEPERERVDTWIQELRAEGIERSDLEKWNARFRRWHAELLSDRGRKAAQKRWSKPQKKGQKALTRPHSVKTDNKHRPKVIKQARRR